MKTKRKWAWRSSSHGRACGLAPEMFLDWNKRPVCVYIPVKLLRGSFVKATETCVTCMHGKIRYTWPRWNFLAGTSCSSVTSRCTGKRIVRCEPEPKALYTRVISYRFWMNKRNKEVNCSPISADVNIKTSGSASSSANRELRKTVHGDLNCSIWTLVDF